MKGAASRQPKGTQGMMCSSQMRILGVLGEAPMRAQPLGTHQGHQDALGAYQEPMAAAITAANFGPGAPSGNPETLASSQQARSSRASVERRDSSLGSFVETHHQPQTATTVHVIVLDSI